MKNTSLLFAILAAGTAQAADVQVYTGICEPSAGASLGGGLFAVASDESNVIRIYDRDKPSPLRSVKTKKHVGWKKSDIEGAAILGETIYWTASQSNNKKGEDEKRKIVFATKIVDEGGKKKLVPVGEVREDLKGGLVKAANSTNKDINVEGLAITPDGELLFGFRNLVDGKASVVKLINTAAVMSDAAVQPEFELAAALDLGGRGIRSMERIGDRYLLVAGRPSDGAKVEFALYWWSGEGTAEGWKTMPDLSELNPEAMIVGEDGKTVQLISDDGDSCPAEDEHDDDDSRTFRSIIVDIPQ